MFIARPVCLFLPSRKHVRQKGHSVAFRQSSDFRQTKEWREKGEDFKWIKIVLRTLQRIIRDETQIREDAVSMSPSRKRKRTGRYEDIDAAMEKCFSSMRAQKKTIIGTEILKRAQSFAKELGIQPYTPSQPDWGLTELYPLIMTTLFKCHDRINVVFFAGQTCDT